MYWMIIIVLTLRPVLNKYSRRKNKFNLILLLHFADFLAHLRPSGDTKTNNNYYYPQRVMKQEIEMSTPLPQYNVRTCEYNCIIIVHDHGQACVQYLSSCCDGIFFFFFLFVKDDSIVKIKIGITDLLPLPRRRRGNKTRHFL